MSVVYQGADGSIAQRTNTYAVANILYDAKPNIVIERWADQENLPKNVGKTMTHRRYHDLPDNMHPIERGVNPNPAKLSWTDISSTLRMFGTSADLDRENYDFHEDKLPMITTKLIGESIARIREKLGVSITKGGSQVIRANGSARTDINTLPSEEDFEIAVEALEGYDAETISKIVTSTAAYGTESIQPSYISYFHTNLSSTLRKLDSFIPYQDYTKMPIPGEIGTVLDKVKLISSNFALPWYNAGASNLNGMRGVTATDVYPITIFAKHAWSVSKLAGVKAVNVNVVKPVASQADRHGLLGFVSSDFYYSGVITNDNYLTRIECCAPSRS